MPLVVVSGVVVKVLSVVVVSGVVVKVMSLVVVSGVVVKVIALVVTFGDGVKVESVSLHPALYGKSHVSNLLFQCRSAGHSLQ